MGKKESYRIPVPLYSLLGSISRPFSSTFFSKSKVNKTDAAASVRVECAICCPAQTLPEMTMMILDIEIKASEENK